MKQKNDVDLLTINKKKYKNVEKNELVKILLTKLYDIQEIIRNTILSINQHNKDEIFSNNDINLSISILTDLYEKSNNIHKKLTSTIKNENINDIIDLLQQVIDKLSMIICGFGTKNINELLFISFGSEFKNLTSQDSILNSKYELITKYITPIGYKIIHWKKTKQSHIHKDTYCENKLIEENTELEDYNIFECLNMNNENDSFKQRIYGIQIIIQNEKSRKTLVISGIIEDIHIDYFTNEYISTRKEEILNLAFGRQNIEKDILKSIIDTLSLKDILIYGNEDIIKRIIIILTDIKNIKQNKLDKTINDFFELDIYSKRILLINLSLVDNDNDIQYISYLLYELLNIDNNDNTTNEQNIIHNSLPWKIKMKYKDIIKQSVTSINDMIQKYDINQITLEQQIYLMKADEKIKEKAILKLKEIKGRPDEMGLKAKQYIEGLIKIPFNIYREEESLKKIKDINKLFIRIISVIKHVFPDFNIINKDHYTVLEINTYIKYINNYSIENIKTLIKPIIDNLNIKQLNLLIQKINTYKKKTKEMRLTITNQTKIAQINKIMNFISNKEISNLTIIYELYDMISNTNTSLSNAINEIKLLHNNVSNIEKNIEQIINVLDNSIYGHSHAKNQIMKIIGQWMNGEQTGYCFGFEGSPGIGKTSLAKKGLSMCLKDDNNNNRPFSFIALGGSCNGSTLEGHSYTYMNSTWGRIVDILMESKCMNPIIYVDELDKVSKTENGREIIGIFTHIIDQTQNDSFQDKYFSGINIDLSKALFIFSYNDPEQIDSILLDRIHRIKFENLTLNEKKVIVNRFILPEINKKMGFTDIIEMNDDIIEYIIETYTLEPGVRKLKELLFDLYGEINLDILKNNNTEVKLPILITPENLECKYLPKYTKIKEKKIHKQPVIGIINGLWANVLGRGGIIPIQTMFFPSSTFLDLRLTGLQGDVMKESMNVSKSLAWNLTPNSIKKKLLTQFNDTKCQGLHIHCPDGSISKDGPSAGAAITIAIYSLFNNKKINNDVAITGEINLQGEITAIGGLDLKIYGGIKAGIKTFLYPIDNTLDFKKWKSNNKDTYNDINFYEVSNIKEVFNYVFI
tara:strand:- start:7396 stop:10659 length:3264 start_codon:yes stop_codon:yes gene_type:complete